MNIFTWKNEPGGPARLRRRVICLRILTFALAWFGMTNLSHAQLTFQDLFANRQTTTNGAGLLTGSNTNATVEVGEPQTGGKPGGHSVWISWVAPADGIATFRTDGSSFDTLLSAYYFGSTNDTTVDKLNETARNDDFLGIAPASLIQFGALTGQHYEIAVDGYEGAAGDIVLNWSFINATSPPPIIVSVPNDQAAKQGDPVTLTVNMQASPSVQLKWRLDENEIEATGTNLFIPSLQPTNVGRYSLRVSIGPVRFFTTPTEIQINSDGQTNTLARDKLLDSEGSPLIGSDGNSLLAPIHRLAMASAGASLIGVVSGYNGSQIFDTTYATSDPNEPPHCGATGGASYWLLYQAPTNGTITLDTIGSTYDTVMEAYTYNGALTGYLDLISVACDNDSIAPQGPSRIQFPLVKTRKYVVVVDGVNAARGIAWLNFSLNSTSPPTPPTLSGVPQPLVVASGSTVVLSPSVAGCPPFQFFWAKDGRAISGVNSSTLVLPNVTPTNSGNYVLTVTNDLGSASATMPLRVVILPTCQMAFTSTGMNLSFPTITGQNYTVEETTNLAGPWQVWTNSFPGNGQLMLIGLTATDRRFYRVWVQ